MVSTTVSNVPTTTAVSVEISVVTATAAAPGISVGDVTVEMSPSFANSLNEGVKTALQACNLLPARLRRRHADPGMYNVEKKIMVCIKSC